jgi:hypothetical protein
MNSSFTLFRQSISDWAVIGACRGLTTNFIT